MQLNHTPDGQWLTAKQPLTCQRCAGTIPKRRRYFATVASIFCAWCAGEVWGVTPRQKEKQ